jgi:tetrahydromethanopterin S-methyltransferase subunit B
MTDDLNQQIGRLEAHVEQLQRDMNDIKGSIKTMSDQMNRWRGAGAILLMVGAAFGWVIDMLYKAMGR